MILKTNFPKGRIPTRPLSYKFVDKAENKELIVDWEKGEIYIKKEDGTIVSVTTSVIESMKDNTEVGDNITIVIPGEGEEGDTIEITLNEFSSMIFEAIENIKVTFEANITTEWEGENTPYTQVIEVPGILESDDPIVDLNLMHDKSLAEASTYQKVLNNIYRISTSNDTIKVYISEKSDIEIPIKLMVVR